MKTCESRMDPSCSTLCCDIYEGTDEVPVSNHVETKTEPKASITQTISSNTEQIANEEQIDELEREDFEEENRLIKQCSGMIVDAQRLTSSSHFPGNLSSANSSLASSSETISSLIISSHPDLNLPGCSSKTVSPNDSKCSTDGNPPSDWPLCDCGVAMIPPNILNGESIPMMSNANENFANESHYKLRNDDNQIMQSWERAGTSKEINSNVYMSIDNEDIIGSLERPDADSENFNELIHGEKNSNMSGGAMDDCIEPEAEEDSSVSFLKKVCLPLQEPDQQDSLPMPHVEQANPFFADYGEDADSEDGEEEEEAWCTCFSNQDSEDDTSEGASQDSSHGASQIPEQVQFSEDINRFWRKRRFDSTMMNESTQTKKLCIDSAASSSGNSVSGSSLEKDWPANLVCSTISNSSLLQGPPDLKQWLNRFNTWSGVERIHAIDALINRCAADQVRHMMKAIEPLFQRDFISLLPKELALTVLGYLQPKDLLRAAQTCRSWRFLADDNLLWKEQCRRVGIVELRKRPRSMPTCASPWKTAYMRQHIIENNWLLRPVGQPKVLKGHDDHVITCLQFYGNRILSGSDDTTLKVWSAVTGKCLRTLVGHSGGVWSSQMVGRLVISGSTDRTLRVWDAKTGECLKILAGHTSTVRCMHLHEDRVVSGSRDATLRVWSVPEGRCLRVLVGHLAAVRCVQYDGRLVVSGAYDYFVKVWNPDTGECLHTLAGHTNRVYSLQFDGVHVVSGSLDTSIRVWEVESGALKHTLMGHQSLTSGMELRSNILVSGNADSTVKVWDIITGHCLHTLSGPNKHQSAVTCLQSSKRFVITSSDDGTVKLWDLRTGEFIRNLVALGSGGSGGVVWRIRASSTKLVCAVGSRNGTEETKLMVLDFDIPGACQKCDD